MNDHLYTDDELARLRTMPKRVTNPSARWSEKPGAAPVHQQRNFQVLAQPEVRFSIYQRQSLLDQADFSCGIRYLPLGATPIVLARYNGSGHIHGDIAYLPHIHAARAEVLVAGLRPDAMATATDRYITLEGALACLLDDYNVAGITAQHDQPRLVP